MISIVCGKKGSGKTKKLLEMANNSVVTAKGEIVFVDLKEKSIYDLNRNIRFINVKEFSINNSDSFYGFVNGLIAENYDIDEIYVDNLLNIINTNLHDLELFLNNLRKIGEKFQVNFVLSANCEEDEVPSFINDYIVALT
jgi:energy-coupling factor transporter ATP-binding protein EcfA2